MRCPSSSPSQTPCRLTAADGKASGLLLLNSNGMDAVPSQDRVRFSIIGGVLDFFIFMGPTPAAVLEQLTRVVGRPAMPPYWSLGFHQCKYAAAVHCQLSRAGGGSCLMLLLCLRCAHGRAPNLPACCASLIVWA